MKQYWIDDAIKRKSGLRQELHVPKDKVIPNQTLEQIKNREQGERITSFGKKVTITKKLKKRATLAMTLKNLQKKER